MDLREFASGGGMSNPEVAEGMAVFGRFMKGDIAVPIVGAAQATAVAGGFELLMGCDVVVDRLLGGALRAGDLVRYAEEEVAAVEPRAGALEFSTAGTLTPVPYADALGVAALVVTVGGSDVPLAVCRHHPRLEQRCHGVVFVAAVPCDP